MFSQLLSHLPTPNGTRTPERAGGGRSLSPPNSRPLDQRPKTTLEERLRANFTLGEASQTTTPDRSAIGTPEPIQPYNIPLPPSPTLPPVYSDVQDLENDITDHPTHVKITNSNVELITDTDSFEEDISNPQDAIGGEKTADGQGIEHTNIELLQQQLKLLETKINEVTTSFKRLQAEKHEANQILKGVTPPLDLDDLDSVRSFAESHATNAKLRFDESQKVKGIQAEHESRLQELRDIHRLESSSRSSQIDRLKRQLEESEALVSAGAKNAAGHKADSDAAKLALTKAETLAKEEEEKREKAVGLLKSVRQKLVKIQKEKEEATTALQKLKAQEQTWSEKGREATAQVETRIVKLEAEKDQALKDAKADCERESLQKQRLLEQEHIALKGQLELELVTAKALHSKEQTSRTAQIASLERSVQSLYKEKSDLFDQLQLRTAELESSQTRLEQSLSQCNELQFQLRHASDNITTLNEEVGELRQRRPDDSQGASEDIARLLLEAEGKYEAKLSDARTKIRLLEKERGQAEDEWARGNNEKTAALGNIRRDLEAREREKNDILTRQKDSDNVIASLEGALRASEQIASQQEARLEDLASEQVALRGREVSLRQELHDSTETAEALTRQLETLSTQDAQLKSTNKNLRDELRKVQSSVALLEKQRNPGVGYWSSVPQRSTDESNGTGQGRASISSDRSSGSRNGSLGEDGDKSAEEVNLEYLRNVILQFLEHKEMRGNLVRVLSTILRFTPQETRRLMTKI